MEIPYTDPAITYAGRWVENHKSIGSAWQGSQIRFRVNGSGTVTARVRVKDSSSVGPTVAVVNIDGGEQKPKVISSAEELFDGSRDVVFELPSTGPHDIVLKIFGSPPEQWAGRTYIGLESISMDKGASISKSDSPCDIKVEFIGDSWMATQNDWPLMLKGYSIAPVSFGGATIKDLDNQYLYGGEAGWTNSRQSAFAVVIGSGVNDFIRGTTIQDYRVAMVSLIGKVRHAHPGAKIVLIQAPKNPAGKDYGKYGSVMSDIASDDRDITYIPFPTEFTTFLDWRKDGIHLPYSGLKKMAELMQPKIDEALKIRPLTTVN